MHQPGLRKRPAPGASPVGQSQVQLPMNYNTNTAQTQNDQFLNWNQGNSINGMENYPDPSNSFSPNLYNSMLPTQNAPDASNQLARRPTGQQVIARGVYNGAGNEAWSGTAEEFPQNVKEEGWNNNDDEALAQRALVAKREAQAKRKSIPPFVQKLSSFLDESRNTDLIRWSSRGDSFIVLDEDEFAKTLIPELFKHNNYASFVRQLNMYGFHKKVGLSDNSMRASERKNKSPSEYYNPYFKQHKPNLLWLIQKPKPTSGKGKGNVKVKQEDGSLDDDVDEPYEVENSTPAPQGPEDHNSTIRNTRQPLMIGQGGNSLPQEDLSAVHRELQAIRHQQRLISGVIQNIKQEHENLYGQAAAFQELHNRHENSINAILTFLATVYNRSLEGHGAQNIHNLFAAPIPPDMQRQGSVVDVGDYDHSGANSASAQLQRSMRRQPLLIGPPPLNSPISEVSTSAAASPAASGIGAQRPQTRLSARQTPSNAYSPADSTSARHDALQDAYIKSNSARSSESPRVSGTKATPNAIPERDILSFINSTNANDTKFLGGNTMDFPAVLSHLQTGNGNTPLTTNQRNNVLQLMANDTAKASANGLITDTNNALTSPNPPEMPLPDMEHWKETKDQLEFLEKTLKEQDSKVANLSTMLQPLSPSGTIPGLHEPQGYMGPSAGPSDTLDFDQMFNSGDYFNDSSTAPDLNFGSDPVDFGGGADFDFDAPLSNGTTNGFGLDGEDEERGRIEAIDSSEATSPANTVDDGGGHEERRSPRKRRRRG
ncbi:stress-responsive transcription factor hsf1 [Xylographa carneopallida]|nr:stress-responsive transcription factor hsf1 [Xylographa carneopallida]